MIAIPFFTTELFLSAQKAFMCTLRTVWCVTSSQKLCSNFPCEAVLRYQIRIVQKIKTQDQILSRTCLLDHPGSILVLMWFLNKSPRCLTTMQQIINIAQLLIATQIEWILFSFRLKNLDNFNSALRRRT